MKIIWAEVIIDPDFEYGPVTEESRQAACADGLDAWACRTLESPPENFGRGLVKIGQHLGLLATRHNLMEYAKKFTSPLAVPAGQPILKNKK